MDRELSMAARREITKKYAHQYRAASKKDKSVLLDSLTATTGWTRDHARRAIRAALTRKGAASQQKRRPRPRKYSYDAVKVLQHVWSVTGQPSGKYLAPVMDDTLNRLERFKEFGKVTRRATPAVLTELRSMSAATIDRYLKPFKDAAYPAAGLSATRPAPHILRAAVPLRTSLDGPITDPGLVEVDTVAHCGHTLVGEFLWTLSATLPVSGYTVLTTVKNKAFVHIGAGMDRIVDQMPVPVAEVHVDNGSEFINWGLIDWAKGHDIAMSRSRPYKKNDNAHVEQRNGDQVRRHAFRYRYETATEFQLLNQLWPLVMARKNHLLPCVKAIGWTTTSAGRKKRVYDKPKTPYQRLVDSGVLDPATRARLAAEHDRLNPADLARRITDIQNQLIRLAERRTQTDQPAA
ncbi:DDE-type integrase/transposase/recombinase [Acidipropionibacterium acidipropionici]|uniref:DDE-type integrase/transposase/recombinase n=1 Tax=Acidipropionibacterium acidipropionici TaxID=1748 RepID=UPI00110B8115|nr:DDE-type integrase/transposase/recombinase [Acidipropionibacterium acidipropionici]QCV94730.1 DDE-type integrase/transposase/recombinase [Acidipropionibacterium acidipropionici]QCV95695.1 DDE-type integrase/transposase/recombinase [Acidipropionibacterium acidipropionici]